MKRAVAPGERLGPPLRAGREYRLRIDGALADAAGIPMGEPYERRFRAVAADRQSPRVADLRVQAPSSAARARDRDPRRSRSTRRSCDAGSGSRTRTGTPSRGRGEVERRRDPLDVRARRGLGAGRYAVTLSGRARGPRRNRFDRLFDRDLTPAAVARPRLLSVPFEVAGP